MSLGRLVAIALSVVGAVLLAIVLYLAFTDLGRHKGQIEAFVTNKIGRPFAIDGALELKVLPSVSLLAERVRIGNAQWGSKPQMLEIGRLSTHIGLWSLISGPVDVRSFELSDVSVLLEKNSEGEGNWALGGGGTSDEASPPDSGVTKVPAVIQHAKLSNVEVIYREAGTPDRIALLATLEIEPGKDGLLALSGTGKLDQYNTTLAGHLGPIDALVSGRNIRMEIQAAIEKLRLDINGSIGRLDPLDGADLSLKLEHPDLGKMLENLRMPVVSTGTLKVDARLKDAGKLTELDLDAKLGDITAKANGTLETLGLPGSDLRFEVSVADAGRLARVFDVTGVPAEVLTASGRVASSREKITFDGLSARLAGAQVRADGTIRLARDRDADIRFELGVENLMKLRKGLPDMPFSMSGNFAESRDKLELKDVKSRFGETELSGRASMTRNGKRHVEAELATPSLDLTPFSKEQTASNATAQSAGKAGTSAANAKQPSKEPKGKYVFSDKPLALDGLKGIDARLHFDAGEVKLGAGMLKDVKGTMVVDAGELAFEGNATGGIEGTLNSALKIKPTSDGAADVELNLVVKNMRAGFAAVEGVEPGLVPPTSIDAHLRTSGVSARQVASSANGQVLLTQGPGRIKSGFIGMFGGGIFSELAGKLNPFSAQDPYTDLDCMVARVDIVDGLATVAPVLVQSKKVTITAHGKVDLHTEDLTIDFGTRPREGIGISAGMFTNPFIKLEGTLANPRVGIGAKGAVSGAVAVATGGASVVAQGLADRARGEADACKATLEEASRPAPRANAVESTDAKP
jgi:uncharacterized protein involved in outer membrane biogenesis